MALNKTTGPAGLNQTNPIETLRKSQTGTSTNAPGTAADFRRALEQFGGLQTPVRPAVQPQNSVGPSASTSAAEKLKFSNHSIERMRSRGISFGAEEMTKIENAIAKAAAKGSKDTLVLSGDNALIVSVKNNTVVTVMDKTAMKENVFTNIDSTVVI